MACVWACRIGLRSQSHLVGQRHVAQGDYVMAEILTIDDDPDFRRFVAQTLSAAGHQISEAKAGIDGVAAFHARHPELVITDIVLSGKVETIHELRRGAPDLKIVAISSSIRADYDFHIATVLGANVVLKKSCSTLKLLSIVANLLPWQEQSAIPMAA
jgi:CheY-like chemotaxis protein